MWLELERAKKKFFKKVYSKAEFLLIKSVISKILYDKSKLDTFGIRLDNWVPTSSDRVAKLPNSSMTQISSVSKLESSLPQILTIIKLFHQFYPSYLRKKIQ